MHNNCIKLTPTLKHIKSSTIPYRNTPIFSYNFHIGKISTHPYQKQPTFNPQNNPTIPKTPTEATSNHNDKTLAHPCRKSHI